VNKVVLTYIIALVKFLRGIIIIFQLFSHTQFLEQKPDTEILEIAYSA